MTASLIRADAAAIPLADDSVDLIVTSPPYFALRSYTDGGEHYDGQIGSELTPQAFLEALWSVTAECRRVLKPSGSMFVNLGDKYSGSGGPGGDYNEGGLRDGQPREEASSYWARMSPANNGIPAKSLMGLPWRYAIGCIDQLDLILRAEIVWSKPNGLPESVTDRVRRSHEQWFHFTKEPRYFSAVDEIREPHAPASIARYETPLVPRTSARGMPGESRDEFQPHQGPNPLGKLPGSVWTPVDYDLWKRELVNGPIRFCPRCGRDLTAGNGQASGRERITVVSQSPAEASNTPTGSPTSSGSAPSPTGSPSTTCAETDGASTPPISKPSPGERTSSAAARASKPTASTDTRSTTHTSTDGPTATVASAEPARSTECVCAGIGSPEAPSSVWTVPSEPLRVPDWLGVDHFAAFPQELPRRLVLGWSPSGVCVECGTGRRPTVEKERVGDGSRPTYVRNANGGAHGHREGHATTEATITGYVCDCPTPDAPTRPAVVLDPFAGTGTSVMVARALGRYGIGLDLSADYLKLARWRVFESGHASKSRERTNRALQGSLL